jgi:AbrB family looped-hinge helix DNA binding protein
LHFGLGHFVTRRDAVYWQSLPPLRLLRKVPFDPYPISRFSDTDNARPSIADIAVSQRTPYNKSTSKEFAETIMSEATMTSKGQVTIPAEIRKAMGLNAGERVVFTQLDDGTTVMRAKTRSILELRGMLKHARGAKKKVGIQDMNIGQS